MKPIIGVPLRYENLEERPILYIPERVRRTLQKAGAEIFILPPVQDFDYIETKIDEFPELTEEEKKFINKSLDKCDGLFLPGGIKFTPYDRYMLSYAIEKKIPTLAVCLSMQMMSCYEEEIELAKIKNNEKHNQKDYDKLMHKVIINKNSKLYNILKEDEIMVNSFHKYHATENHIYETTAVSEDNIIEALEYPSPFFNIGVQWHPEVSYDFDENSKKIIDSFITEAKHQKEQRNKENIKYVNS